LLPVLQKLPCTQTVWRFTPTIRTRLRPSRRSPSPRDGK
jgi:hypothetical protein